MNGHCSPARTLAVLTALLTFFQGALWSTTPEARFWAERRRTVEQRFGRDSLQSAVPEVGQGLGQLEVEVAGSAFTPAALSRSAAGVVPAWCPPSLALNGQIQEAARSLRPGPARGTVLHILDVHSAYEAQYHIAELLEKISRARGDNPPDNLLVGLEGATGGFLIDKAKYWAVPETLPQAADLLLRANILSGPEVFGAKTATFATLWGVENHWAYLENIDAYRRTFPYRAKDRRDLESLTGEIDRLKSLLFPPLLKTLDTQGRRFNQHLGNMGEFVALLTRHADPRDINPNLRRFSQALTQEKMLNFPQAARERARLLEALGEDLSSRESQDLMDWAGKYRSGQISPAKFHGELRRLMAVQGVKVGRLPEFEKYIRYLELAESVNKLELARDIRLLEKTVVLRECRTPAQRGLAEMTWDLDQVRKLINYGLTPDEWTLYQSRSADRARIPQRLKALTPAHDLKAPVDVFGRLQAYEDFYRAAEARNDAMVTNLEKRWSKTTSRDPAGGRTAVLVAGGFHGPGVRDILLRRGYNYVAISPKLTDLKKIPDSLAQFDGASTPLLNQFLSPERRSAVSSQTASQTVLGLVVLSLAQFYFSRTDQSQKASFIAQLGQKNITLTFNENANQITLGGLPGSEMAWTAKKQAEGTVTLTPPSDLARTPAKLSPMDSVMASIASVFSLPMNLAKKGMAQLFLSFSDRLGLWEVSQRLEPIVFQMMDNTTNQLPMELRQVFDLVLEPNRSPLVRMLSGFGEEDAAAKSTTPSLSDTFKSAAKNSPLMALRLQALTSFHRMNAWSYFHTAQLLARNQFILQALLLNTAQTLARKSSGETAAAEILPLIAAVDGLLKDAPSLQRDRVLNAFWNAYVAGVTLSKTENSSHITFEAKTITDAQALLATALDNNSVNKETDTLFLVGREENKVVSLIPGQTTPKDMPDISVKNYLTKSGQLNAAALVKALLLKSNVSKKDLLTTLTTFVTSNPETLFIDPRSDIPLILRDRNFKLLLQLTQEYIGLRKAIETSA